MEDKLKEALDNSASRALNPQVVQMQVAGCFRFTGYLSVCGKSLAQFAQDNNCVIKVLPVVTGLEIHCSGAQTASVPPAAIDPSQFGEKLLAGTTATTNAAATALHTCPLPDSGIDNTQLQAIAANGTVVNISVRRTAVTVISAVPSADTHSLFQCLRSKGHARLTAPRPLGRRNLRSTAAKATLRLKARRETRSGGFFSIFRG